MNGTGDSSGDGGNTGFSRRVYAASESPLGATNHLKAPACSPPSYATLRPSTRPFASGHLNRKTARGPRESNGSNLLCG